MNVPSFASPWMTTLLNAVEVRPATSVTSRRNSYMPLSNRDGSNVPSVPLVTDVVELERMVYRLPEPATRYARIHVASVALLAVPTISVRVVIGLPSVGALSVATGASPDG